MRRSELADLMMHVFDEEIMFLREQGQKEYAHDTDNAFANFERIADDLDLSMEEVLWVYAMKHRDGIASYIQGHESQREDVRGRINDLIVYLFLLRGMIEEREHEPGGRAWTGAESEQEILSNEQEPDTPDSEGKKTDWGDPPREPSEDDVKDTVDPQTGDPLASQFGGVTPQS